jgi:dephospho-CoA kinase
MGSGKSTVAQIFRFLGVPVFDADAEARDLLEYDTETRDAVLKLFGQRAFDSNGIPDRSYIGKLAFNNPEKLRELNRVVHPRIGSLSDLWHQGHTEAYTLHEAALLVESGSYTRYDALVVVTAPQAIKIKRVVARSGWSRRHIMDRLSQQMKQGELLTFADYVIKNDGKSLLIPQILAIHKNIMARCGSVPVRPAF